MYIYCKIQYNGNELINKIFYIEFEVLKILNDTEKCDYGLFRFGAASQNLNFYLNSRKTY